MKKDIHPQYNNKAKVKCACGNSFITGSTKDEIYVEICSACHPFYTGKQKLVDTARRVEKFEDKAKKTAAMKARKKTKKTKDKTADKKSDDQKTDDKGGLKDQLKKVAKKADK